MNWLSTTCMLAFGWRRALLLIGAGALAGLAMPPFFVLPTLFFSFPILIWCLDGAEKTGPRNPVFGPSFFIGLFFGFGYFLTSLHWLGAAFFVDGGAQLVLMPFALVAIALVLALFWGVATRIAFLLWSAGWSRIFVLAASFAIMEFARGHILTGFPFNILGIALTANSEMMQILSLVGIYGLTVLVILLASTPALIWPHDERALTQRLAPFFLAILVIGGQLAYGQYRLASTEILVRDDMRVRIVQPVINQKIKWQPDAAGFIEDQLINLSQAQTGPDDTGLANVTHLVWPEAALPFYLDESPLTFSRLARLLPANTLLFAGMPRRNVGSGDTINAYNSILAIDGEGEIVGTYDKVHLVPIGEFLPFKQVFSAIGLTQFVPGSDGWTHGETRRTMAPIGSPSILPLICYEAIFPNEMGQNLSDAQILLNVTNDAWFDGSIGPRQHFHHAVLRAVENGLPMIRAANSGISALIDPLGRVTDALQEGEVGVVDGSVAHPLPTTFYRQFGQGLFWSLCLICAGIGIAFRQTAHR